MKICLDVHFLKLLPECIGSSLTLIMCYDDTTYHQTTVGKFVFQTKNIHVISYAKIAADLILFNIHSTDNDDDFSVICQLHEHSQFAVGLKTWQNS